MTIAMRRETAVLSLLMFVVFFHSLATFGQGARVRITAPIDNTALVLVPRTHHPLASAANDLGRVTRNSTMNHIVLVLKPSNEQASALTRLINDQHDTQSATYLN